jgi:hypothetical protein
VTSLWEGQLTNNAIFGTMIQSACASLGDISGSAFTLRLGTYVTVSLGLNFTFVFSRISLKQSRGYNTDYQKFRGDI